MQIFDFKLDYYNLDDLEFTTIRGGSWDKKIKIGDKVTISKRGEFLYVAQVCVKVLSPIGNLLSYTLINDTGYPGFELRYGFEHKDFITLLNTFYPRSTMLHLRADMETRVCLFKLRRI